MWTCFYLCRMRLSRFLLVLTAFFLTNTVYSQSITEPTPVDSLFVLKPAPLPKRPWLAASEIVGLNLGVWAFDRYVIDGHYARISLKTMENNLRKGFYWDNDNFSTNLFNHPYHGSLYHNAARSNGMNYWQSGLFTLGGSLMWELFMECELPSKNDLIMTTIGGSALGEMLFRSSDLVLDNRLSGKSRIGQEVLGFILSPARGLTRLLTGDAWKLRPNSGRQFHIPELKFSLAGGVKALELRNFDEDIFDVSVGLVLDGRMEYGELMEDDNTPFSYFNLHADVNVMKNQPIVGQLNIMGRLAGKMIYENKRNQLYLGAFHHFDYYDSDSLANAVKVRGTKTPYVVGTPAALGLGLVYDGRFFNNSLHIRSNVYFNAILLGASLSDYYRGDKRNYNWGSGYSIKESLDIRYKNKIFLSFNTDYYRLFTWRGYNPNMDPGMIDYKTLNVQGDKSKAYYTILESIVGYEFNPRWGIYYQRFDFFRDTNYAHYPDFKTTTSDARLMLKYKF